MFGMGKIESKSNWSSKAKLNETSRMSHISIYLLVMKVSLKETNDCMFTILVMYKEPDHVSALLALGPG